MLLKTRNIVFMGIMIAFGILLILCGTIFQTSTIVFLAAAAYLSGVIQYNYGYKMGLIYLCGTALLGLFICPEKLFILTFSIFCFYVLLEDILEGKLEKDNSKKLFVSSWIVKILVIILLFAVLFLIVNLFFDIKDILLSPKLTKLYKKSLGGFYAAFFVCFAAFFVVFDRGYAFARRRYGYMFRIDRYIKDDK